MAKLSDINQIKEKHMPTVAQILDLKGQTMYSDYGQTTSRRKCTGWYVSDHYVSSSVADCVYVKRCGSRAAAVKWATSPKRVKEFGENVKFYITRA